MGRCGSSIEPQWGMGTLLCDLGIEVRAWLPTKAASSWQKDYFVSTNGEADRAR